MKEDTVEYSCGELTDKQEEQRAMQDIQLKKLAKKIGCDELGGRYATMSIGTKDDTTFDFIDLLFRVCQYCDKMTDIVKS